MSEWTNVDGYLRIDRDWSVGDVAELEFPMPPRWVSAHPNIAENTGQVALTRGPLVYCLESADPHPDQLRIAIDQEVSPVQEEALVGLRFTAEHVLPDPGWEDSLYRPTVGDEARGEPVAVTAIPYYAWANGKAAPMRVWLKRTLTAGRS
jgi:hypothetical protein